MSMINHIGTLILFNDYVCKLNQRCMLYINIGVTSYGELRHVPPEDPKKMLQILRHNCFCNHHFDAP